MKYTALLYHSEEGVAVSVRELSGCWSEGVTEEEALNNIRDAIADYLMSIEKEARDANAKFVEVTI